MSCSDRRNAAREDDLAQAADALLARYAVPRAQPTPHSTGAVRPP